MGLFKRQQPSTTGVTRPAGLQPPDAKAAEAKDLYSQQRFSTSLDAYGEAIDKLHTMYVMGGSRYRTPSADDDTILNGFVSALGASLAVNKSEPITNAVEQACGYLLQIEQMCASEGIDGRRYAVAIADIDRAFRLGRS